MLTWGEFNDQIRRSQLLDLDGANWSPDQIHDYIGWALDTFANHTALMKQMVYSADAFDQAGVPYDMSTATSFALPDDAFESVEVAGRVILVYNNGSVITLDPLKKTPGLKPSNNAAASYHVWPTGTLNIFQPVGVGGTVYLDYFAYYPKPSIDDPDSLILVPRWAYKAVSSLVAAYALEAYAVQSATIDRWKDRSDSGNPEHNALRAQQAFLMRNYEIELTKRPPQDRVNMFREYNQWR